MYCYINLKVKAGKSQFNPLQQAALPCAVWRHAALNVILGPLLFFFKEVYSQMYTDDTVIHVTTETTANSFESTSFEFVYVM